MGYYEVTRNVTVIPYVDIRSLLINNGYEDIWKSQFWDEVRVNDSGEIIYLEPSYVDERINDVMILIKNHFEIDGDQCIMWVSW
jgi:hypothetical protein